MNYLIQKKNILIAILFVVSFVISPNFVNAQYYSYDSYTPSYGYDSYSSDYGYDSYSSSYDSGSYSSSYDYDSYTPDYSYDSYTSDYSYDSYTPDYSYDSYTSDYSYDSYTSDYSYDSYTSDYSYNDYSDTYSSAYSNSYDNYSYPTYAYDYSNNTSCYGSGCSSSSSSKSLSVQCVVSDTSIKAGESVTYTAKVSGGTSPFSYDWSGSVDSSSKSVTKKYSSSGTYNASVKVTDDRGRTAYDDCSSVSVSKTTTSTNNLSVQCVVSDTSIKEGESVTYTANVSGGNSPYTYDWNGSVNSSSRSVSIKYSNDGTYSASVTVKDEDGKTASDNCATVHVSNTTNDSSNFGVQCVVSDTSVDEGDYVTFTAEVSGNTSPYTYDWNGDVNSTSKSVKTRFNDGSYDVSVTVKDKNGKSITDDCATVNVGSNNDNNNDNLDVQCKVSDSSVDDGDYVTVSVDINDGNSPYDITWSGDTGDFRSFNKSDDSQKVRVDTSSSRIELEVTVEDDDGNEESDTCIIRIGDDYSSGSYNDGELSGLSSVFLSQVPYTGSEDVLKTIGFIVGLLIWSAIIATVLLRNKNKKEISSKAAAFKEANKLKKFSN